MWKLTVSQSPPYSYRNQFAQMQEKFEVKADHKKNAGLALISAFVDTLPPRERAIQQEQARGAFVDTLPSRERSIQQERAREQARSVLQIHDQLRAEAMRRWARGPQGLNLRRGPQ